MKVYYFNDQQKPVVVNVDTLGSHKAKLLRAAEGSYFDVNVTENQALFIKVWATGQVLLSSMSQPEPEPNGELSQASQI